jgi:ATP-dependent RNA helicase DeaD
LKIYQKLKGLFSADSAKKKDSGKESQAGRRGKSDGRSAASGESSGGGSRRGRGGRRRPRRDGSQDGRRQQSSGSSTDSRPEGTSKSSGESKKSDGGKGESSNRSRRSRGGRGRPAGAGSARRGSGHSAGEHDSKRQGKVDNRGRSSRDRKRRAAGGTKRSDMGNASKRIEFPELLDLSHDSEAYINNEFRPLGLNDEIVMALARNRFRTPTDIQREVIPAGIEGRDILGQAKTGTGKTVAFVMPLFQRLDHDLKSVQALIVVPTRELCRQVSWEACRFSRDFDFKVMSVYGGTSVRDEIEELRTSPGQIVVGTPGRLLDHISNSNIDLTHVTAIVLDEADRMFDIGFRQDIIKIISACPDKRQIMLLSATMDGAVEDLASRFMHDPVKLYVSKDEVTVDSIWQRYIAVERRRKIETLIKLLHQQNPTQSIVFTNTKRMSDAVALKLEKQGFKARCIHSDLSQNKRERIMDNFRTGKIEHLIATDVAARGLDITGISHVINYDIPDNPEDYVHRVGRTGRMGAAGKAFTFVSSSEGDQLTKVEMFINKMLDSWELSDGEKDGNSDEPINA